MSKFSGKCDFADIVESRGADEIIKNYSAYTYGNDVVPLRTDSVKDLVPYYPYLVAVMCADEGGGIIRLSRKSFVDEEEEERLTWEMDAVKKYWRKCNRKKERFDKNEALSRIHWPSDNTVQAYEIEIVNRVAELGNKAKIDGIHIPFYDKAYRTALYEEMRNYGYTEDWAYRWSFGWDRWYERTAKEKERHEDE